MLFANTEVMQRPKSGFTPHFDIKNTYQVRTKKLNSSDRRLLPTTLLERWLQVYCIKITIELIPNYWLISTNTNSMKSFVNWIPANTHVCSNKTQPYLKAGVSLE